MISMIKYLKDGVLKLILPSFYRSIKLYSDDGLNIYERVKCNLGKGFY